MSAQLYNQIKTYADDNGYAFVYTDDESTALMEAAASGNWVIILMPMHQYAEVTGGLSSQVSIAVVRIYNYQDETLFDTDPAAIILSKLLRTLSLIGGERQYVAFDDRQNTGLFGATVTVSERLAVCN